MIYLFYDLCDSLSFGETENFTESSKAYDTFT